MEIQKQSFSSQQNFKGFHVLDTKAQKSLLTSLNSKQLNTLSGYVKEQESNSVHILLTSATLFLRILSIFGVKEISINKTPI